MRDLFPERFALAAEGKKEDQCWEWPGPVSKKGYPFSRKTMAYLIVYRMHHGPIPDGLEIDHTCSNRRCVNPGHLEAVTHKENTLRSRNFIAMNAKKTHCAGGHPLTGEHLGYQTKAGRLARFCRTCAREAKRRYKERQRS